VQQVRRPLGQPLRLAYVTATGASKIANKSMLILSPSRLYAFLRHQPPTTGISIAALSGLHGHQTLLHLDGVTGLTNTSMTVTF
jgi:hypothetical protein